ncbi:uncharacterized protein LOC118197546 [Stegodyphus dumicola]|uniref:uncharacterized protein LOC118197546 n=1 Tax=Stegodyphus dumicola TaxID=202533 RepID=UPI0015AD0E6D|nr:uncharacterized protein LOC118197546 [Stegodyphus dumicola]
MKLVERKNRIDGFEWMCRVTGGECRHRISRSVRKNSWFAKSKLSMCDVLRVTYMWLGKCGNDFIRTELRIAKNTVTDWKSFCREVCMELCLKENVMLGGEGVIVEIDESKFGKQKYHRGKRVEGRWVFGLVERGTDKCVFRVVENRGAETLLEIIKENVLPGSIVISDCWKAYDCLEFEGYAHLKVNHSLRFKDPETGAHTNSIEGTWAAIKRSFRGSSKAKGQFDSYLAEYIWRRKHKKSDASQLMHIFLSEITAIYSAKGED